MQVFAIEDGMPKKYVWFLLVLLTTSTVWAEAAELSSLSIKPPRVTGHFSKEAWEKALKVSSNKTIDREDEFRRFLQDYNFIGMQKKEVVELLGEEDIQSQFHKPVYTIISAPIDVGLTLAIDYKNDKVSQWQIESVGTSGPPIHSNVLWCGLHPILNENGKLQAYFEKETSD